MLEYSPNQKNEYSKKVVSVNPSRDKLSREIGRVVGPAAAQVITNIYIYIYIYSNN